MTRNHHEKVDGSGYPDRLKKSDIPLGARIMALVDAFDAMTTDRPYRPRLSFREAIDEVKDHYNRQFDPEVVRPFISVIRKEVLSEVENPTIVPLMHEHLDPVTLSRILELPALAEAAVSSGASQGAGQGKPSVFIAFCGLMKEAMRSWGK